jgi:hypothetical protein
MFLHSIHADRTLPNPKLNSYGHGLQTRMSPTTPNLAKQNIKETTLSSNRRSHFNRTALLCSSLFLLLIFLPSLAGATQVNLAWDSVDPANGYRVFMRMSTGSYNYSAPAWQGTATTCRIDQLQPGQTYSFVARAVATGDESGNSNEVSYTVPNQAPVANAGPDLAVNTGTPVTLDGSASSDPDGTLAAYRWTQISGPAVSLAGSTTSKASFQAPGITSTATLVFQLAVTDNLGLSSNDTCRVTVAPSVTSGGGGSQPGSGGGDATAARIWIEAEDGDIFSPMQIIADSNASNGDAVVAPGGAGTGGYAAYRFDIQRAGNYVMWARVLARTEASNSYFISINGVANVNWPLPVSSQWQWVRYGQTMTFQQGRQSIFFRHREYNTHLDKLLITNDAGYIPQGMGASVHDQTTHVVIEAESGVMSRPMQVQRDQDASGNGFVWVPNGRGTITSPSAGAGRVIYEFHVSQGGDYRIWGRVRAPSGTSDSFFAAVNDGPFERWNTQRGDTWTWDLVNSHNVADPRIYRLQAGRNTLTIMQREEGTQLDKIVITSDPDYTPAGTGEPQSVSSLAEPVTLVDLEAEDALILSKFTTGSDPAASASAFLWVPRGGGNYGSPSPDCGLAVFDFYVSEPGDYRIWARVLAPSGAEDSFFVAMNDGNYINWNVPIGTRWNWELVSLAGSPVLYRLAAGMHTLNLMHREDGTRIDRLVITNNLQFTPN